MRSLRCGRRLPDHHLPRPRACAGPGHARWNGFAELMGRTTGCCSGVGGSMHFTDFSQGLHRSVRDRRRGLPVAVGAALSAKLQGSTAARSPSSATAPRNIGTFHEAINMAAVWKVARRLHHREQPLRRVHARCATTTPLDDLAERAKSVRHPGRDRRRPGRRLVHAAVSEAVARARAGEGPSLLEMKTYRFRGHSRTDPAKYRRRGRARALAGARSDHRPRGAHRGRGRAVRGGAGSAPRRDPAARRRHRRPRQAGARADHRGDPQLCLRRLSRAAAAVGDAVEMTCREAVNAALEDEMAADPTLYLLGEDVAHEGGVFKTNGGLPEQVPRPRQEHAHLREHVRRDGDRHVGHRPPPDRRDHVLGLPARRPATRSSKSCPSSAS